MVIVWCKILFQLISKGNVDTPDIYIKMRELLKTVDSNEDIELMKWYYLFSAYNSNSRVKIRKVEIEICRLKL